MTDQHIIDRDHAEGARTQKTCGCGPDCRCGPDCACGPNGRCAPACACAD